MKKKNKIVSGILNLLIVILSCVCIFCLYQLGSIWWGYHTNDQTQERVQQLFYGKSAEEAISDANANGEQEYTFNLKPVIMANADTVGWIRMPDTVIDYAVVQGDDNDWYLTHGFYGEENTAGAIFMDYQNAMDQPLQNWIVYGHRMRNGSMFGGLGELLDAEFYQKHPAFTFITEETQYECEIFSVYQCTTEVDYCQPSFGSEDEMNAYIQECRDRSIYQTSIKVSADDTIITLSTCDYVLDPQAGRLVVHAKLVEKDQENGKAET